MSKTFLSRGEWDKSMVKKFMKSKSSPNLEFDNSEKNKDLVVIIIHSNPDNESWVKSKDGEFYMASSIEQILNKHGWESSADGYVDSGDLTYYIARIPPPPPNCIDIKEEGKCDTPRCVWENNKCKTKRKKRRRKRTNKNGGSKKKLKKLKKSKKHRK